MPTANKTQTISPWLGVIFIMLLGVLVGLFIKNISQKNISYNTGVLAINNKETAIIKSLTGQVKKIEDDKIFFTIESSPTGQKNISDLIAIITENTLFYQSEIPRTVPEEKSGELFKKTEAALKDIKVNDYITITSNDNLAGKKEFEVTSVNKLYLAK